MLAGFGGEGWRVRTVAIPIWFKHDINACETRDFSRVRFPFSDGSQDRHSSIVGLDASGKCVHAIEDRSNEFIRGLRPSGLHSLEEAVDSPLLT